MTTSVRSWTLPIIALMLAVPSVPAAAGQPPLPNPLIFVQYEIPEEPEEAIRGNLYRLDPDGTVTAITDRDDAAIRDPEISFDATRIVFSMQIGPDTAPWQVYEIGVDGSGLRKVSPSAKDNDLDPSYLPDGRILFTTDRLRWSDGYENVPATQLAVMNSDGSGVEVLKVNPSGHINPLVGSDGLIYFTQWDFHDRRVNMDEEHDDFDVNRFLLWQVFADGSGLDHPAFGAHTIDDFTPGYVEIRERPTAPGTFVATSGSEDTQELTSFHPDRLIFVPGTFLTFEGANLTVLEPQADQNDDEAIEVAGENVDDEPGLWRAPLPLSDGRLIASWTPGEWEERPEAPLPFELWIMNGDGSNKETLLESPGLWNLQAVELVARTPPTLQTGVMRPEYPYAVINAFDVTLREDDDQPVPSPGQVTAIRVYREDVRTPNTHDLQMDEGGIGAFDPWDDPDTEFLGTAPVHPDESFAVVVPADTPVTWELVDAGGNVVVRERFGTELRAGELRQCAGCHSPHDGTMGSTTNFALENPTNLSGQNVDLDENGVVDLLEDLCANMPELCGGGKVIFADNFENGSTAQWDGAD